MEEKRELEEIKEVEWEMLDIELAKGFDIEEGMAGDEAADETGNGRGEGILSMVSNAKTSSAFQRAQIHPSSVDLGQCWPMYLPPNGCPPTVLSLHLPREQSTLCWLELFEIFGKTGQHHFASY